MASGIDDTLPADTLDKTLEPDRVYDRFHDLLADVVEHDGVLVSSYDESDGLIRCEYAWSDGNRLDTAVFPALPLNREGGGMQSRVIVSGEPLVFNDVAEVVQRPGGTYYDVDSEGTMRKVPDEGAPKAQAAMMLPVKHEGAVVGELFGATAGVGELIYYSEANFNTNGVFAGMVLLAAMALLAEALITSLENRLVRWRPPALGSEIQI